MNRKSIHSGGDHLKDKKADVFNYGRELFYSNGFKNTNISDITKMAGVGVGTLYKLLRVEREVVLGDLCKRK